MFCRGCRADEDRRRGTFPPEAASFRRTAIRSAGSIRDAPVAVLRSMAAVRGPRSPPALGVVTVVGADQAAMSPPTAPTQGEKAISMRSWLQLSDLGLAQKIDYAEKNGAESDTALNDFAAVRAHLSRLAWDAYAEAIGDRGTLAGTGVMCFPLGDDVAHRLIDAFAQSPHLKMQRDDFAIGYMADRGQAACDHLNRANDYHEWMPEMAAVVDSVLAAMTSKLEVALAIRSGSCRAVSSIFCRTPASPASTWTAWSCSIRKLFLLPRGATREIGTAAGSACATAKSVIESTRPVMVLFGARRVARPPPGAATTPDDELDLAPAPTTSARAFYAGLNGWYPWFPTKATFLEGTRTAARIAGARESRGLWQRLFCA